LYKGGLEVYIVIDVIVSNDPIVDKLLVYV